MPKHNKKVKKSKKSKKIKKIKKSNPSIKNINYTSSLSLSLDDHSLLDLKKSKSFSVATTLSEYKSKSHIGDIYDTKPLHDKINNLCVNKIITKEPSLNKKNSKKICECLFEKNKDLSITELESKIKNKIHTPSSHCITILDTLTKINAKSSKSSSKSSNKKSKSKN